MPRRFSVAISQPLRCHSCTTLSTAAMVSASPLRVQTTDGAGRISVVMGAAYCAHSGLLRSSGWISVLSCTAATQLPPRSASSESDELL